jgi:peptide deformylase
MQLAKSDDPILHRVCRADFVLNADTIQQMFHLLEEAGGLGLAAPQVGIVSRGALNPATDGRVDTSQ